MGNFFHVREGRTEGRTTAVRSPKVAMVRPEGLAKVPGMHSRTLESLALIAVAVAVDLVAIPATGTLRPCRDPRHEAERQVRLPEPWATFSGADRRRVDGWRWGSSWTSPAGLASVNGPEGRVLYA